MRHLPVFLVLQGRNVLVLGDGDIAARNAAPLAQVGATIRRRTRFDPADLDGCAFAIGADAPEPDLHALFAEATRRGIPVNIVDRPELCTSLTPSIIDRDPVLIAISTGGAAPLLARLLRARIEAAIPPAFGRLAALAEEVSPELRRRQPDVALRRQVLERIFTGPTADLVFAGDDTTARAAMRAEIDRADGLERQGRATLIGTGPGAPDLLTLRAHRLMGEADSIIRDATVPDAVAKLARRDAHAVIATDPAAAEDATLQRLALGERVVWLFPGAATAAPAAAERLRAAGWPVELVPGIATHMPG